MPSDTTSPGGPAGGPGGATRKRRLRYVAFTLVILVVVEGCGWIADGIWDHRRKLLSALDAMTVVLDPVPARPTSPWRNERLVVRSPRDMPPKEPYRVGGREIPGAAVIRTHATVAPADIVRMEAKRVFVLGGSASIGPFYRYEDSFAGRLGAGIGPDGYDVVNAGQQAAASGFVIGVLRAVLESYDPDTVILLTGNNEWIQWVPPAQPWADQSRLALIRALAHSRMLALVEYLVLRGAIERQDQSRQELEGFAVHRELTGFEYALEHPLERYTTFDRPRWERTRERYLDNFEANLRLAVDLAEKRGVRVVLMTVPFRHRLSPVWKHPQPESSGSAKSESIRAAVDAAADHLRAGRHVEGLAAVDGALAEDDFPPILHYLRGVALEQAGEPADAEKAYARCRDRMIGNLGGCLAINDRVRKVAGDTGAVLVDAQRALEEHQHARGRYFSDGLIADDCHLTPEGHAVVAEALIRYFRER